MFKDNVENHIVLVSSGIPSNTTTITSFYTKVKKTALFWKHLNHYYKSDLEIVMEKEVGKQNMIIGQSFYLIISIKIIVCVILGDFYIKKKEPWKRGTR